VADEELYREAFFRLTIDTTIFGKKMIEFNEILKWLENRSSTTRWVLVPIIFFVSSFLIHTTVVIVVWLLSFIPTKIGLDSESRFVWFQLVIGANLLSAYGSAIVSGWVAPKFKYPVVCVGASFYIVSNSSFLYSMAMNDFAGGADNLWAMLSIIFGAVAAVIHAKSIFSN
jgi:hypothetical protein|tara:strand:+ start:135 stop:647 length:513 start_codon:yes stop_codon:yes gene_type:complete